MDSENPEKERLVRGALKEGINPGGESYHQWGRLPAGSLPTLRERTGKPEFFDSTPLPLANDRLSVSLTSNISPRMAERLRRNLTGEWFIAEMVWFGPNISFGIMPGHCCGDPAWIHPRITDFIMEFSMSIDRLFYFLIREPERAAVIARATLSPQWWQDLERSLCGGSRDFQINGVVRLNNIDFECNPDQSEDVIAFNDKGERVGLWAPSST
jgi:hypothetical protein